MIGLFSFDGIVGVIRFNIIRDLFRVDVLNMLLLVGFLGVEEILSEGELILEAVIE
jgi:uncharacterized membrane protein YuzA (DUF378 family)